MSLATITATFPFLDTWHDVLAQPLVPATGSDLATDDTDWPPVPVSQVAVMGLGSARDHLQAVRIHVEIKQLFPFAHLSTIRGALVGSAQAVWVLSPENSSERIERSRRVAAHMYAEHEKYLTVLRSLTDEPHENTEIVAAHVGERRKQLADRRAGDNQLAKLNTTDMIREAARAAFKDEALDAEVLSVWRLTSGAAHGFAWALFGQPGTVQSGPPDQDGIAPFAAGGDLDRIFPNYMAAFHLTRHGMELLADRSALMP